MPYTYIRKQIFTIESILNDKEYSSKKRLEAIESALRVLHVEGYFDIDQETKQRIINLKNNIKNKENYSIDELLLQSAQLIDHVIKVSE